MANKMTMFNLISYLHQRMLNSLAENNEEDLDNLSGALMEIWKAAEHYEDRNLYELLDDMNYVVNETLMGARPKGERCLASVASKLEQMGAAEQESSKGF